MKRTTGLWVHGICATVLVALGACTPAKPAESAEAPADETPAEASSGSSGGSSGSSGSSGGSGGINVPGPVIPPSKGGSGGNAPTGGGQKGSCPKKGGLMPNAISTLDYLSKKYKLSIITNGFEEIQNLKLTAGDLHNYFDHVVTSQHAGFKKPSKEIFQYTLTKNSILCNQPVMIGDNLVTDIGGARQASIHSVYFNHEQTQHEAEIHVEISKLSELCELL